jgi:hypothetical protein
MVTVLTRGFRQLVTALIGVRTELPREFVEQYPELAAVRWRRGGVFVRAGGWALLQPTAAAITLWRTVFLAPSTPWDAALLLHELRHVHHFTASRAFPLLYLWESVRRGYANNRFETDANEFARRRLCRPPRAHGQPSSAKDL